MAGDPPFVIVGAGAIGGILGAHLVTAGHEVVLIDANRDHVAAIAGNGLRISGTSELLVRAPAFHPDDYTEPLIRVLLAVKSRQTHPAVAAFADRLTPDGYVVSLQNGLEEYKIAERVGPARTIGAYLTFGGFYTEPGHVVHAGTGSLKLGELDGRITPRMEGLRDALSSLQPVDLTENIFGYLWAKMALGAMYFATALVDADVLDIYADSENRQLLGRLAGEVAAVAEAADIAVETCDGFDPKLFHPERPGAAAAIGASWEAQQRYWSRIEGGRTGVWRDLALRKSGTEVDEMVGAVLRTAERVGRPVPHLQRLANLIHEVERGTRPQAWQNLRMLALAA